jgi:hypothetical protein
MHETFWTLLQDPAHWEFELFLMLVFDGMIFGLLFPFVRLHWQHHVRHDEADRAQDIDNAAIQAAANRSLDAFTGRIAHLDSPVPETYNSPSLRRALWTIPPKNIPVESLTWPDTVDLIWKPASYQYRYYSGARPPEL